MPGILALVDGSTYSQSVCDHAAWVAKRRNLPVTLMHVLARPAPGSSDLSGNLGLGARSKLLEQLADLDAQKATLSKQHGRAILEDAENRVRSLGVSETSTLLRHGDLIEELAAAEEGMDLVVVGKRGEAADLETLRLGSNLEQVVRASVIPVLVASRELKPLNRLLLAFDGGPNAEMAVKHLETADTFSGFEVTLLTVGIDNSDNRTRLEAAEKRLASAGYSVTARIQPGRADSVIAELVQDLGIDLVIMGAFGHSRIRNFFIGSTTSEMVRSLRVPLLLFR